jgi:uncharacterized protein YdaU (DUF1376 family)
MHFYRFYINDYMVSTRHLSNDEDLCYRRLLDLYYTEEDPLADDKQMLSRKIQMKAEVVEVILNEKFEKTPEGWINGRAHAEITAYAALCEKRSTSGKSGGRPKAKQRKASANQKQTTSQASAPISVISNQLSDTPIVPTGDTPIDLIDDNLALHRAKMLFRMRPSTVLDSSQDRAWKKNKGAVESTSEGDWLLLEWYFAQGGEVAEYRRRDLATLLNNWHGEIQRATEIAKKKGSTFGKKENPAPECVAPRNWRELLVNQFPESYPDGLASANFPSSFTLLPQSVQAELHECDALAAEIRADIHRNSTIAQEAA